MITISNGATAQIGLATSFVRLPDHTQLDTHQVGYFWTSDQLIAETATYTTHKQHKGWTPMPSEGFESAIPTIERLQNSTLEFTAIGIGKGCISVKQTLTPMYLPVYIYIYIYIYMWVCVCVCVYVCVCVFVCIYTGIVAVTFFSMYPMFLFRILQGP